MMERKNAQFWKKVAETVAEPKDAKVSTTKLILKDKKHLHQMTFET